MRRCPVCAGHGAVVLHSTDQVSGQEFGVARCDTCGASYTDPLPADLGPFYPDDSYYSFGTVRPSAMERLRLWLIRHIAYEMVADRPAGRMLDIGCGSGRLAGSWRRAGWDVAGVEPSATAARSARESGMEVHVGTLEDPDLPFAPGSFDAIVFNHSLEHVGDPVAALARAAELCRAGGIVAVSVPNSESWQARAWGPDWFQLDVPRHLTHFTPRSLVLAAQRAGLTPRQMRTVSMAADLPASASRRLGRGLPPRATRLVQYGMLPLTLAEAVSRRGNVVNLCAEAHVSA